MNYISSRIINKIINLKFKIIINFFLQIIDNEQTIVIKKYSYTIFEKN